MRIRLFTITVAALLLALAVAPNSMAQGNKVTINKAQATFSTPSFRGQASLAPASSRSPSTVSGAQGGVEIDRQATGMHPKAAAAQPGTGGPAVPTPNVPIVLGGSNIDWNGLNNGDSRNVNGFDLEPPDQGLCVGNGFEIEAINLVMAFYDSVGNMQFGPISLNNFFLEPNINFTSDPRCYYDTGTGRFFITMLVIDNGNGPSPYRSHVDIAVSNDANPLHGFGLFAIDTTDDGSDGTPLHGGCPCFGDQPVIGANRDGFYISTNEFSISGFTYNNVQIYAMSKSLLEGFVLGTVVHFNNVQDHGAFPTFSIHPAIAPDVGGAEPAGGTEFFLAGRDFAGSGAAVTTVGAWAITGTSTLVNVSPSLTLSEAIAAATEKYNVPPDAAQKGSTNLIATDDDRFQEVMYEGGFLQAALSTGNPPVGGGSTYPAIAWFVIKPTISGSVISAATKIKNGYVVGPSSGSNHTALMYPNLAVNGNNVGIISFSLTEPGSGSAGFFPSSAYIHYSEAGGTSGNIHVVAKGVAAENGFTCSSCRWGDYSWAILDDLDPTQMWLATENIDGVTSDANVNWSTHVAAVPVP
jgi:hypothetical protein